MIFTTKMTQLVAVVLDSDINTVTKELLDQSLLHFVSIKEISHDWDNKVEHVVPQVSLARIGEQRKRIESLLGIIKHDPDDDIQLDIKKLAPVDLEAVQKDLNKIADKMQGFRDRQRVIQQEILKYEDIKRQLQLFGDLDTGIHSQSKYSFLSFRTGALKSVNINQFEMALKPIPSVLMTFNPEENMTHLLLICMKRDEAKIDAIQERFGWFDVDLQENLEDMQGNVNEDINVKLRALKDEQEELKHKSDEHLELHKKNLIKMWENLRLNELYYKIQTFFSKTSRTVVFSGWLPSKKQPKLEKAIRQITGGRCYMEWNTPKEAAKQGKPKIPVQFNNPKILQPFQMLVQNFSLPEYGTVDPTPFVAVAYLTMFGLMFGDAGQGLVLMLIGFLGRIFYKGKETGVKNLIKLITWCGGAAVIAGVLFGSYFGMPWFEPLWFDYHGIIAGHTPDAGVIKNIYDILGVTIYFGISVIGLGLVLNWVNLIIKKKWFKFCFDKGGVLGVWMYGGGVYSAFFFMSTNTLPDSTLLFFLLGLPAILFMLKPPLEFAIHKKHDPSLKFTAMTIIDFIMEWIVEMLEVFSGYLANTLSFMRVAGLGIAHTSLMIAFFEMAKMANGGSAENLGPMGIFILVLGNVLVISLEGLSAGIQSLRLNYYEFFSKYFSGSGEAYSPVSLRKNN